MKSTATFDERYADTMRHMWGFAHNDQRPAVLDWISCCRLGGSVLDIGPGDAYYMDVVQPTACTLVEPNAFLRRTAAARCAALCGKVRVFATVADLLKEDTDLSGDLVLMIHVLFYIPPAEIQLLLEAFKGRRVAMVHPLPDGAVTVEFEESIGLTACRDRVAQKNRLLGMPDTRRVSNSHFRLPISVTNEELAFLVAHPTLDSAHAEVRLAAALNFVHTRRPQWTRSNYLELPQAQVLETYNF